MSEFRPENELETAFCGARNATLSIEQFPRRQKYCATGLAFDRSCWKRQECASSLPGTVNKLAKNLIAREKQRQRIAS